MKIINIKSAALGATLMAATAPAHASIVISEVASWGSSSSYAADWFELTNTGASAVNISGWMMDDNSNGTAKVALRGVTTIASGQSVVFLEGDSTGTTDATIDGNFKSAWFGANAPAGLVIGNYGGSGVGLSSTADAVNIFNGSGALITRVDFGAATTGFSFDNAAGLDNVTISQLSAVGVNGAFKSFNGLEAGSPGTISAVPVPAAVWLFGSALAGLGVVGKRRKAESY